MNARKMMNLLASATIAGAALASAPLAQAGTQRHPDRHPQIIAILKHPDRHPQIIAVRHPEIFGVLKHPDFGLMMRKSGGDPNGSGRT